MLLRWLFDFWFLSQVVFGIFGSNAKGQASQNAETGQAWGSQYNQQGTQDRNAVLPFLQNELTNPTGLGPQTVAEMKTQGGEIAAGGVGAATEAGNLLASRTGNTAAAPGIIDAAARSGMRAEATNASGVDIENAKLKEAQRQAGAGGLAGMYGEDVAASMKALGLSTEATNAETNAMSAGLQPFETAMTAAAGGAGTAMA